MSSNTLLAAAAILPFLGSVLAGALPSRARNVAAALAGLVTLTSLGCILALTPQLAGGSSVVHAIDWLPSLGVRFVLRLDGLAWLFSVLVLAIGALVVLYARYYMSPADPVPRLFAYFLAFVGAMLGIILAGNLIQLVLFWELTSIVSFLLIGYWYDNAAARDGARMSLTITAAGGLCLLVGTILIGRIVGSYDLETVLASGDTIRNSPLYLPALVLVLAGALTKSAQFPFHIWLPRAMAAPTPISAYLHSATMVKAGIFLMIRLWPVLAGTDAWYWIVGTIGMATMLIGSWSAIFQHDLKGLLAYSTISHLGLITTLLSLGSPLAAVAAIFHMVNHATFKASLFMAAGIIDHETGTRDMRRLSGLYTYMPATATLAMAASAAMAGVPLFNGFLSKEMFFAEAVETHADSLLDRALPYVATLSGAFAVAYSLRFIHTVFFGPKPVDLPNPHPHEPPRWMRFPIEFLVFACLIVGIVPSLSIGPFLHSAVLSVLGAQTPVYSLSIWHGFNLPLIMSIAALIGGVTIYALLGGYFSRCDDGPPVFRHLRGQRIFERILVTVSWKWARWLESTLGTRRLQPQLRLLILVALLAGFSPLFLSEFSLSLPRVTTFDPIFAILWLIGMIAAMGAAWQAKYHRLAALVMLGVSGLVTCLTFVWLSAPDLAITQLLVEIVTTVLILLGLRWLPKRVEKVDSSDELPAQLRRARDFLLAAGSGIGMSVIAYAVMTLPVPNAIATYFLERAYTEGGGTNVVNVILVDFRGFDTFGEIAVLAIVALTVFALLRRFRPAHESIGVPEQQQMQNAFDAERPDRSKGDTVRDYLYVPSIVMQWMFPVIITFSIFLFMRGHDLPGGGFAAGITMAIAFLLQYLAGGARWAEDRIRILPLRWMGFGLLMATATGIGSWYFGYPFLTSYFQYTEIPYIGKMPTASALLFDLGVFSLVVGSTVLILIALAHQSLRNYRVRTPDAAKAEDV